jgi:uncharacterized membrane protein YbhN (UPF0104 family)
LAQRSHGKIAMPRRESASDGPAARRRGRSLPWLVGFAALAAVILTATHIAEPREFARLVERVEIWWVAVAIGLQAATYVALAQVWRTVVRAGGDRLAPLDGGTTWVLLRAVGVDAPVAGTFAAYMIAALARTISFMPGGLGAFEAVAVVTLHEIGVPVAAALSASLLFRGLSYWVPMIPGFIASRRLG